jgi:hypothetical protein
MGLPRTGVAEAASVSDRRDFFATRNGEYLAIRSHVLRVHFAPFSSGAGGLVVHDPALAQEDTTHDARHRETRVGSGRSPTF